MSAAAFVRTPHLAAQEIAEALGAKAAGRGKWKMCCIAHEEKTPSLYITEAGERTLLKCWGGCEQSEIIDALRARGLWSAGSGAPRANYVPRPRSPDRRELRWLLDDLYLLDAEPGAGQVWAFLRDAAEISGFLLECTSRALRKRRPACSPHVRRWFDRHMTPAEDLQEQAL